MKYLQVFARMFFRAMVVSMLMLNYDNKQIWALPFGLLIAILSESEFLTRKKNQKRDLTT